MKLIKTSIPDVYEIELDCYGDNRGWFMETYNEQAFKKLGINNIFVQDNMSFSAIKGTLRGIHYQNDPYSQAKLVRCTKGEVLDIAVDLRKGSPTYTKWVSCVLSETNHKLLYIPQGFGHAFLTLSDNVEFQYKCDNFYNKESEGNIIYNDKTINIDWNSFLNGIEPILSDKDKNAPILEKADFNFKY